MQYPSPARAGYASAAGPRLDANPVCGFFEDRYRVPGIGYRLSGTWDLVPGTGAGPTPGAEHRAPKTEPGYRKTRTSGMQDTGRRMAVLSCLLYP
jgi:hypothetical protein